MGSGGGRRQGLRDYGLRRGDVYRPCRSGYRRASYRRRAEPLAGNDRSALCNVGLFA